MTNTHIWLNYFQFVFLVALSALSFWGPLWIIFIGMGAFFVSELFLLEQVRRMKPEKIRLRKGCFFAFADLFAVFYFMLLFLIFGWQLYCGETSVPGGRLPLLGLLVYTLIRKYNIYKNFTYEK